MTESPAQRDAPPSGRRHWYQALGPGLITACVVIGPGSILTSSQVGANYGFSVVWVLVVSVVFMMIYMTLGAKLGVVANASPGDLVTRLAGRPLAAAIGVGVFFISAAFQFGNNLGVHSAIGTYIADAAYAPYIVVAFNALAVAFLFAFRNLYRVVERLMMAFVGLMLFAFAANLAFAFARRGEVPAPAVAPGGFDWPVFGWVGTTFVISAAFYQAYLVRQKGWSRVELRNGLVDARVGAVLLTLITLMIMSTSALVLRGRTLQSVTEVATQLRPLFGVWGHALFCLGLFSAAYSSFLINSMIGGFILSDGLGLGSAPRNLWPRLLSTAVLLTGMGIALLVVQAGWKPVPAIVAAQAVTVIASPLMAGALLWLTNRTDIMGNERNRPVTNLLGGLGFLVLCGLAWHVAAHKVWPAIQAGWGG